MTKDVTRRMSRLRDLSFPLVVAHRGFRTRAPENTLAAFEAAATAGAAMIEFDVGLTRDGVPVVIHDAEVDRTTDGVGRVDDLTLAEIQALDAGGWFHPRFAGERVPTLAQVLDRMGGRVALNIEIKPEAAVPRFQNGSGIEPVERQVMAMVQARGLAESVLISSFDGGVLDRLAAARAPLALGVLAERGDVAEAVRRCLRLGAFSWHPDFRRLSADAVRRVRQETGARILPYTVNDPAEMDKLLALGADGFFTDDPAAARRRMGRE
ncbi:MAG: glycerophosphodiester phosphodiesterase [Desulfococcaceae bacterium]